MGGCVNPKTYLLPVAFSLTVMSTALAGIIYVDADAPGANDGSSWADAYNYLQDALADANSAAKPLEIHVGHGIYTPDSNSADPNGSGDRGATFQLINGVTLKGGYAGFGEPKPNARDIQLYETILTGDLDGDDVEVTNSVDLLYEPTRAENSYHVMNGSGTDEIAILDGFNITAGNANGGGENSYGGGLYIAAGRPMVLNCEFRANAVCVYGGGVHLDDHSAPVFVKCTFRGNSATDGGGLNSDYSTPLLIGCIFLDNYTDFFGPDSADGAGIYLYYSNARLENCLIARNFSNQVGGGICTRHESYATLVNCTIAGNFGYGVYGYGTTWLINSIVWDNKPDGSHGNAYGEYNCVQGTWEGDGVGNIHDDPCFAEPNDDYHLLPNSLCIDAGDPDYIVKSDETDLDGRPRIIGGRIDIGAYEYSPPISVRIIPHTFNLASQSNWITALLRLGKDYNGGDIEPNSVLLEGEIEPQWLRIDEEKQVVIAMFSREELQDILTIGEVKLTITGRLTDGTIFETKDVIIVINKGGRKSAL